MASIVRVGPAGWSYQDWKGIVYPPRPGSRFDPLAYLAGFFDTIEINSTFYRPPSGATALSWVKRVNENSSLKFTVKLYRKFTHERGEATEEDWKACREGFDPLAEAGKLGAMLIQFPWSFKNTAETREYLSDLLDRFKEYPRVVELRHASWNTPAVYESLERRGVGFCNIDQPLFARSIGPSALSTSEVGYVRLHGRNYGNWFSEAASPADRYDYLYSPGELDPWIENVRTVAERSQETYVVTNNHYQGKGVVNALQIKARLTGEKVPAPPALIECYPDELEPIVLTS
ncbi:MAG TPA: DUF72 domain-containing protein [Blastocatellia bacterium]|nr:DUF72 domain-containing protein [Blastocatellia bacterium]